MPQRSVPRGLVAALAALASTAPAVASADDPAWDMQLKVESDLRFRLESEYTGSVLHQTGVPAGVERNQNMLGARFVVAWENVKAVAEADLFLFGYQSELEGIGALSEIDEIQPYRIDVPELYVEVSDLVLDGFNLRVGQQIVSWGVADQFNPTNLLNSDDLIDPLLFGKQLGNFMVKADYWVTDDYSISAVLVPLFRPARLPTTASLGVAQLGRVPFLEDELRWRVETERSAAERFFQTPTVLNSVTIDTPDTSFENMQAAFRLAGTVLEQDWALSYYYGRNDFPVPLKNHTTQDAAVRCAEPPFGELCTAGHLLTDVTLGYPKMHAYGLNVAGEIFVGYRVEAALYVPEKSKMKLTQQGVTLGGFPVPEPEYDYDGDGVSGPGRKRPTIVDDTPFLKWTVGLDYTFPANVYANLMWVHGLADEFGAGDWIGGANEVRASGFAPGITELPEFLDRCVDLTALPPRVVGTRCAREILRPRIADYIVAGVDVRFLDDQLLTRLFTILEVSGYQESTVARGERVVNAMPFYTPEGFSASIFPEVSYNFGNGLELAAGSLFNLGKTYTKFGDPAAGGSVTFLRARYTL
jgi:hypothetical protein